MENSLLLESFIRKLDAKYRVLSGDTISTFRTQAHEEASQVREATSKSSQVFEGLIASHGCWSADCPAFD